MRGTSRTSRRKNNLLQEAWMTEKCKEISSPSLKARTIADMNGTLHTLDTYLKRY